MLKIVPDNLKTETICKHAFKKLTYLLKYVPDQDKTPQICDKAIMQNGGTLKYVILLWKFPKWIN